jgi:uncharacterized SAM-binding protein YcdF (DUF218 family)
MFWIFKLAFKFVAVLMTLILLYLGITFLQIWYRGGEHSSGPAQAVLVFGTASYGCTTPSPELAARLSWAAQLVHNGDLTTNLIVVTGGKKPGDACTEAQTSTWYLVHVRGISRHDIIVGGGDDTWQNVSSIAGQLKRLKDTTVLSVTDPFHEYRAMACATDQGLTPMPAPVPHEAISGGSLFGYYLKETLEVGAARVIGYRTLSDWLHS